MKCKPKKAETPTQEIKFMFMACVSEHKKIGLWELKKKDWEKCTTSAGKQARGIGWKFLFPYLGKSGVFLGVFPGVFAVAHARFSGCLSAIKRGYLRAKIPPCGVVKSGGFCPGPFRVHLRPKAATTRPALAPHNAAAMLSAQIPTL